MHARARAGAGERAVDAAVVSHGSLQQDAEVAALAAPALFLFSDNDAQIPDAFRAAPFVFLANIDPRLQLQVLDQVERPRLVACDTMNFWIESRRPELLELLGRVDLVTLNDGEARQLTERANLVQAARWILDRGPRFVLIKKGEHGAFMFTRDSIFFAPAYPLESVFDPTGAGDSFAGGFIGYLAATGDLSERGMRRAVVVGSAMGSFAVERVSNARLMEVSRADIDAQQMVFEIYGLMLAMHQDARLLRSAGSARRARIGLARLLEAAAGTPIHSSRTPSRRASSRKPV
jgi:hypothetical protein